MKSRNAVKVAMVMLVFAVAAQAQFKGQAERQAQSSGGLITQPSSSTFFFGWFDPDRFSMHHTFDLSYTTIGGQGMSLGTYTNSMMYRFADNLDARADVSMSYSPFNSFGSFGAKGTKDFSGIYLSRAQVDYRPWENVSVQLQYRQIPYGYFNSPFYHPLYGETGF
jgi:hypothetical protein